MKVLIDTNGTIIASPQESVFKLSNAYNELKLYSPYGPDNPVMVNFMRYDGVQPISRYMGYVGQGDYDATNTGLYIYIYHLTAYQLAVTGILQMSISIIVNDSTVSTGTFTADVEASLPVNPENPPIDESVATDLQSQINDKQTQINTINTEINTIETTAAAANTKSDNAVSTANAANSKSDEAVNSVNNVSTGLVSVQSQVDLKATIEQLNQAISNIKGGVAVEYDTLQKIISLVGAASGIAPLGADSKISSIYLPSYVDDVIEVANFAALPASGETGKIYVTIDNNLTYRWSGTAYIEISKSLALGETSATAYRGDRGKEMYDFVSSALGGNTLQVLLAAKANKTDFAFTTGAVLDNAFTYDCSLRKNYNLTNTQDIILTITNPTNGFKGELRVYGCSLTLPVNSILSADFGYITRVGNMNYLYEFTYDGTNYHFSRIAEGVE